MLVSHATADEAGSPFGGPVIVAMFAVGALALAVGQILSVRKLHALARAVTTHIDIDQVARSLRRSGWSIVFNLYAIIFGLQFLLTAQTRPPLFALFLLLIIAPLLLEFSQAGWVHRRLNQPAEYPDSAAFRLLPPGIGPRIRNGQPLVVGVHALFGGMAAILLGATIVTETHSATAALPATIVQIVAAIAATAVPLLPIRAVLLVRAAISGDMVHLATLRRAGASFIRAGTATVPLTALVIASIPATPAVPSIAVTRSGLLVYVLVAATLQFVSLSSIHIGDFPKRWLRAADLDRGAKPRRHFRPTRRPGDEHAVGGAEPDRVGHDHAGNAPASPAAVTGSSPVVCPRCVQADQVQHVPALHRAALSTSDGGGPAAGAAGGNAISDRAASFGPPSDRNEGTTILACALAGTAGATVLFGIFLGVMVAVEPSSSLGHFLGSVVFIWILLLPGAVIFAALLLGYVSVRRRTDRRRAHLSAAIERWRLGCYCHRCGGAFFPAGTGQNVPAGRLMSAGEFRDAVQGGNGRS
jgi:hypothetical protein